MIKELLNTGEENKISKRTLLTALEISEREFVKQVHRERQAGALILSTTHDGGGYYLPANEGEIKNYVNSMEKRAQNTFVAIRAARAALKVAEDQLDFSDVFGDFDSEKGGAARC